MFVYSVGLWLVVYFGGYLMWCGLFWMLVMGVMMLFILFSGAVGW